MWQVRWTSSLQIGHSVRMTDATHATVTTLRTDLAKEAERIQEMNRIRERGFDHVPGFVAALWTIDRENSEVVIIHTFDSLQSAESFAAQQPEQRRPPS